MKLIEFNGIEIPIALHNKYIDRLIANIFKILPIYEDCIYTPEKSLEQYQMYLEKVITGLMGAERLYNGTVFIEIALYLKEYKYEKTWLKKK